MLLSSSRKLNSMNEQSEWTGILATKKVEKREGVLEGNREDKISDQNKMPKDLEENPPMKDRGKIAMIVPDKTEVIEWNGREQERGMTTIDHKEDVTVKEKELTTGLVARKMKRAMITDSLLIA